MLVHPARPLRQPAGPTSPAQPQHEVDVLPVGEQPLVEAVHLEERLRVERRRRRRGPTGRPGPFSTSTRSPFR